MPSTDHLFRAGGALAPEEMAFSESVYPENEFKPLQFAALRNFIPQVICSPKLTGKTTQLNYLANAQEMFERRSGLRRIDIDLSIQPGQLGQDEFLQLLGEVLEAEDRETIRAIVVSSRALTLASRTLVAIINVERLPDATLRWLLANIKILNEEYGALLLGRRVQFVIDGSFSVQTLTAGPDSEFPMQQLYPPEFGRSAQREFVTDRLSKLGLTLTEAALADLFEATLGDKYLTQEISLRLALDYGELSPPREIDSSALAVLLDEFVNTPLVYYELGRSLAVGLDELRGLYHGSLSEVISLIRSIDREWKTLPREVRAICYKSGLVRRSGETGVRLRAPVVLSVLERTCERVDSAQEILESGFSLDSVIDLERAAAERLLGSIERDSLHGTLIALHAGVGRRLERDVLECRMSALDKGEYSARLRLRLPDFVHLGEEVWVILRSYESERGTRISEFRTFCMRPIGEGNEVNESR